jgi:hypothetical protein
MEFDLISLLKTNPAFLADVQEYIQPILVKHYPETSLTEQSLAFYNKGTGVVNKSGFLNALLEFQSQNRNNIEYVLAKQFGRAVKILCRDIIIDQQGEVRIQSVELDNIIPYRKLKLSYEEKCELYYQMGIHFRQFQKIKVYAMQVGDTIIDGSGRSKEYVHNLVWTPVSVEPKFTVLSDKDITMYMNDTGLTLDVFRSESALRKIVKAISEK